MFNATALRLLILIATFCVAPAPGPKFIVAYCDDAISELYQQELATSFVALHYWQSGPGQLADCLVKPSSPAALDVQFQPFTSNCSASQVFQGAMPLFSTVEAARPHIIIGCHCSLAAESVGRFSTAYAVPQILTAADLSDLSDKTEFPYIFRVCPMELSNSDIHAGIIGVGPSVRSLMVSTQRHQTHAALCLQLILTFPLGCVFLFN
jgi:hypothetical protein